MLGVLRTLGLVLLPRHGVGNESRLRFERGAAVGVGEANTVRARLMALPVTGLIVMHAFTPATAGGFVEAAAVHIGFDVALRVVSDEAKIGSAKAVVDVAEDAGLCYGPALLDTMGNASVRSSSGNPATTADLGSIAHLVPLLPAADSLRHGFVRVINHSRESGEVRIDAVDATGLDYERLTLSIDGGTAVHFNAADLERGNPGKRLTGGTGAGEGGWRLALTSDLDIEVLSYVGTTDGFLTAMHDLAPEVEVGVHRVVIFDPSGDTAQVSRLRLINMEDEEAQVTIEGVDDRGVSPGGAVQVNVAPCASWTLTAAELESGSGTGMTGALGDGAGKWRLTVTSEASLRVQSLLSSPMGYLTNLSTVPMYALDGVHHVPLFPSASDTLGRQGILRIINHGEAAAEITVTAQDDTEKAYEPLTLSLAPGQVVHINSNDLEQGNLSKGLAGQTGAGEGHWRLRVSSNFDIEVLSYIGTRDGLLTTMHDVAPVRGPRHHVAMFNPGSGTTQMSWLRIVNPGEASADVTIAGTDDRGQSPGSHVVATVPAGGVRTYSAAELEAGADDLEGALGDGTGKWRLDVVADEPIRVLSLLSSSSDHLTNLSTSPGRLAGEDPEDVFRTLISPIVQDRCVTCHVDGGVSGNTSVVFVKSEDAEHLRKNYRVFGAFLDAVEGGAELILNKVQGIDHGGGTQVASGTIELSDKKWFLRLLEGDEFGRPAPSLRFSEPRAIAADVGGVVAVLAADLDGDGDADVLTAARRDGGVAWHRNLGGGAFSSRRAISAAAGSAVSVHAADLDGDGDLDVLAASWRDDLVAWYENLGGGTFSPERAITTDAAGASSVHAGDLDGDGDLDVLVASWGDDAVSWHENLGAGAFSTRRAIATDTDGIQSVYAADLDDDGDADVLTCSSGDGTVAWHANLGDGEFSARRAIITVADGVQSAFAADLDGDGDKDVLSASFGNGMVAWHKNLGGVRFSGRRPVSHRLKGAEAVYAADLDGDGDVDVLSASFGDDPVVWHENLGAGVFSKRGVIADGPDRSASVHAADLDGDGDLDVLSTSHRDGAVWWYANLGAPSAAIGPGPHAPSAAP